MLKKLLLPFVALWVILEEWIWDTLVIAGHWLFLFLHLQRFEERLSRLGPAQALIAMAIPVLVLTPVNLYALLLLSTGNIFLGIVLEIIAKLLGTLIVARIFRLVQPALMTYEWFRIIYVNIMFVLGWAHNLIRDTEIYRLSQHLKQAFKLWAGMLVTLYRFYGGWLRGK